MGSMRHESKGNKAWRKLYGEVARGSRRCRVGGWSGLRLKNVVPFTVQSQMLSLKLNSLKKEAKQVHVRQSFFRQDGATVPLASFLDIGPVKKQPGTGLEKKESPDEEQNDPTTDWPTLRSKVQSYDELAPSTMNTVKNRAILRRNWKTALTYSNPPYQGEFKPPSEEVTYPTKNDCRLCPQSDVILTLLIFLKANFPLQMLANLSPVFTSRQA